MYIFQFSTLTLPSHTPIAVAAPNTPNKFTTDKDLGLLTKINMAEEQEVSAIL